MNKQSSAKIEFNRRQFIHRSGAALAIALSPLVSANHGLSGGGRNNGSYGEAASNGPDIGEGTWLMLHPDNRVTFVLDRIEIGQGITTSHAQMVAEELNMDASDLEVVAAPVGPYYAHPWFRSQMTAGSTSTSAAWLPLRETMAKVRGLILEVAAILWDEDPALLRLESKTIKGPSGRKQTLGELVQQLPADKWPTVSGRVQVTPKLPEQWTQIGKGHQRLDSADKITGVHTYGNDLQLPGMVYAYLLTPAALGDRLESYSWVEAATDYELVPVKDRALAVIGPRWWGARSAAKKAKVSWTKGLRPMDTATIAREHHLMLENQPGSAHYHLPYLPHGALEPLNCTVSVEPGRVRCWVGSQIPQQVRDLLVTMTGYTAEQVDVYTMPVGGSFGRRAALAYVQDAVILALTVNRPVQVMWDRQAEFRMDLYRPMVTAKVGGMVKNGRIQNWSVAVVTSNLGAYIREGYFAAPPRGRGQLTGRGRQQALEGIAELPYDLGASPQLDAQTFEGGIPVGFWRSVGHSTNCFVVESWVDELGASESLDPGQWRLELMSRQQPMTMVQQRAVRVLRTVLTAAGWKMGAFPQAFKQGGRNIGLGVAQSYCFGSFVAIVARVVDDGDGWQLEKLFAVVDCGQVVNPDIVKQQLEGGMLYGLGAMKHQEITFEKGSAQQQEFRTCQALRFYESPEVEVKVLPSLESPGGMGEVGVPAVAPAVANGVFALTGRRVRQLPFLPAFEQAVKVSS